MTGAHMLIIKKNGIVLTDYNYKYIEAMDIYGLSEYLYNLVCKNRLDDKIEVEITTELSE